MYWFAPSLARRCTGAMKKKECEVRNAYLPLQKERCRSKVPKWSDLLSYIFVPNPASSTQIGTMVHALKAYTIRNWFILISPLHKARIQIFKHIRHHQVTPILIFVQTLSTSSHFHECCKNIVSTQALETLGSITLQAIVFSQAIQNDLFAFALKLLDSLQFSLRSIKCGSLCWPAKDSFPSKAPR